MIEYTHYFKTMNTEGIRELSLQKTLKNGEIISQRQFTQLILQQRGINSLTLITMAYMAPPEDDNSVLQIHHHLLQLAHQGASIHVGVDYNYAYLIAPHTDFPNPVARLLMPREKLETERVRRAHLYTDLATHPNINLVFHRQNGRFPLSRFDHRKILHVKGGSPDFAVIYGFNMDKTLDHGVDSGIYITDPEALAWIANQKTKNFSSPPEKVCFDNFAFVTRETQLKGEEFADRTISEIVRGAQETVLFCGQFIPDGTLLQDLIDAANRDVHVSIISNGPSLSRQPVYLPVRILAEKRLARASRALYNLHFYQPEDSNDFVHVKALMADVNRPIARAVTGTDNMAHPLLRYFKTREVLGELLNSDYILNLYAYIQKNVLNTVRKVPFD